MGPLERYSQSPWAALAVWGVILASFVGMFAYTTPTMYDITLPINYISYWHIGLAWAAGIALFATFLGSAQFLRTRKRFWNLLAHSAGEVGFLFLTGTLAMGSIWGSELWGTYWSWGDVRLVTLFIAWLVYLGYLLVFASTRDAEDRFAAVYGVLGFVTIPISYLSTRLLNPVLHAPTLNGGTGETVIEPAVLGLALVGSLLLFVYLVSLRLRLHRARDRVLRTEDTL
jgi:heme exporter protein C